MDRLMEDASTNPATMDSKAHADSDDDSENDEDFVPQPQEDDEDIDEGEQALNSSDGNEPPRLSAKQLAAVDDAFEALFGYRYVNRPKRLAVAASKNKRRYSSQQEALLVDMFGRTVANQVMALRTPQRKPIQLPSLAQVRETSVTQVQQFAGRQISVQRSFPGGQAVAKQPASALKPPSDSSRSKTLTSGLDKVLAEIEGPSKLSTVAKTSADWDTFKTDTGMQDELETQAQGSKAYLVKKDFLQRVDQRRFQREKAQRDLQRASRK